MLRHSSYYEVRLSHIARNIARIRKHYAPKAALIAMVKGDAYGHGLLPVSDYMYRRCDIRYFGVASLGEGLVLLRRQPHTYYTRVQAGGAGFREVTAPLTVDHADSTVVVFSDTELLHADLRRCYAEQNEKQCTGLGGSARLIPVVGSLPALAAYCKDKGTTFQDTPLFLKLNSGMCRLGLHRDELKEAARLIHVHGGGVVDTVLQHFSVSGLVGHSFTSRQLALFKEMTRELCHVHGLRIAHTSIANSGAIEQRLGVEETYVRPGLMCYGPTSLVKKTIPASNGSLRLWDGEAAGFFYTKILHRFIVRAGAYVGYGITGNLATENMLVVLLPVGYADGFLRYYTGMPVCLSPAALHGTVSAARTATVPPIIGHVHGSINMDMIAVAVYPRDVQGYTLEDLYTMVQEDTEVLLWGADVADKAAAVKTVPYQLLCGLSSRIPRVYVEEDGDESAMA